MGGRGETKRSHWDQTVLELPWECGSRMSNSESIFFVKHRCQDTGQAHGPASNANILHQNQSMPSSQPSYTQSVEGHEPYELEFPLPETLSPRNEDQNKGK